MMQDVYAHRDLGKVAHVEPFLPGPNGSRPWMLEPFLPSNHGCWKCVFTVVAKQLLLGNRLHILNKPIRASFRCPKCHGNWNPITVHDL